MHTCTACLSYRDMWAIWGAREFPLAWGFPLVVPVFWSSLASMFAAQNTEVTHQKQLWTNPTVIYTIYTYFANILAWRLIEHAIWYSILGPHTKTPYNNNNQNENAHIKKLKLCAHSVCLTCPTDTAGINRKATSREEQLEKLTPSKLWVLLLLFLTQVQRATPS